MDRARCAHHALGENGDKLNPIEYFIMANVEARHEERPDIVDIYRRALNEYEEDTPIPNILAERSYEIDEQLTGEWDWFKEVLKFVAYYDEGFISMWEWRPKAEEIADMCYPSGKKSTVSLEREITRSLATLGITARYSGNYKHNDVPCKRDGTCCSLYDPNPTLDRVPACLPNRQHFYFSPHGPSHFKFKDRVGHVVHELCVICGTQKRTGSSNAGHASFIEYDSVRQTLPVAIMVGPSIVIAGGPGAPMNHHDPPAAFDTLVNETFRNRAIITAEGEDVSHLSCERCGRWTGNPEDPVIGHVSTSHEDGCPEPDIDGP